MQRASGTLCIGKKVSLLDLIMPGTVDSDLGLVHVVYEQQGKVFTPGRSQQLHEQHSEVCTRSHLIPSMCR